MCLSQQGVTSSPSCRTVIIHCLCRFISFLLEHQLKSKLLNVAVNSRSAPLFIMAAKVRAPKECSDYGREACNALSPSGLGMSMTFRADMPNGQSPRWLKSACY